MLRFINEEIKEALPKQFSERNYLSSGEIEKDVQLFIDEQKSKTYVIPLKPFIQSVQNVCFFTFLCEVKI